MTDNNISTITRLARELQTRHWTCAVAESCTGGMVGATITSVSGVSAWFAGGVISYSNDVKTALLGVSKTTLETCGAVSAPVVKEMAYGACRATGAQVAVALSGIAGPEGGSPDKPVGTVWIGIAVNGQTSAFLQHFSGNRHEIRCQATAVALSLLANAVEHFPERSQA